MPYKSFDDAIEGGASVCIQAIVWSTVEKGIQATNKKEPRTVHLMEKRVQVFEGVANGMCDVGLTYLEDFQEEQAKGYDGFGCGLALVGMPLLNVRLESIFPTRAFQWTAS